MKKTLLFTRIFLLLIILTAAIQGQAQVVAGFRFEGNLQDWARTGMTGTPTGYPVTLGVTLVDYQADAREGGYSLGLNGSQSVSLGSPTILPYGNTARTVCAWAKSNNVSGTRTLFAYGGYNTNQSVFIGQNGTALVAGTLGNVITISNFWTAGVWHHVAFTFDGTTAKLYADGVYLTGISMTLNTTAANTFIGMNVNSAENWVGLVDDVRVITGALTTTDVANQVKQATRLVAEWQLETNAQEWFTSAGALVNNPGFTTDSRVWQYAARLNGTDQYIDMTNPASLPTGSSPRTLSLWAKTNTLTGTRTAVAYGSAVTNQSMFIGQNGTSLVAGAYGNAITVSSFWTANVWHHIALTYDGATARLFIDGVLNTTTNMSWSIVTGSSYIGRNVNNLEFWSGDIDDVRVYKTPLSVPEVSQLGTAPQAPTALATSSVTPNTATLTWTNNATIPCTYPVVQSLTSTAGFTVVGTVQSNGTSLALTGLSEGTSYYFKVRAANNAAYSDYTSVLNVITPPNPPTPVTTTAGSSTSVTINWSDNSNVETGYQIERSTTSGTGYTVVTTTAADVNTYTDAGRTAGTTYYYRIKTLYNSTGTAYSNESSVTTMTAAQQTKIQNALSNLAFQYAYDGRGRMTQKKVPGAGWLYMVYDDRDRVVMTQDANQRAANQWMLTKYDALNRPVITALYTHSSTVDQAGMSALLSTANFYEAYNGATATHGYTSTVWPTSSYTVLTVSYYDDYRFVTDLSWGTAYNYTTGDISGQEAASNVNTNGHPTGGKVNVLGTTNYLKSAMYYDGKYHSIQIITDNNKGGWDRTTNVVDFTGRVLNNKTIHHTATHSDQTIARRMVYDHGSRMKQIFHSVNTIGEKLLVQNEYNEVGQLVDKKLYSTDNGSTFKQSVDYRYNIRGWLSSMNNSQLAVSAATNDDTNDLFGMELGYQNTIGTGNTALWSGNISAMKWSSNGAQGTVKDVGYNYSYDPLNRITTATYLSNSAGTWANATNAFSESGYTFDRNGNIKTLKRWGATGNVLDSMYYVYSGNQLLKVEDSGDKTQGFIDGANTGNDYTYDVNGNMVSDQNKSLTAANAIQYNHLNLPMQVTKSTNEKIVYTYDAGGRKLIQQVYNAAGTVVKTTDYNGEFIYQGDTLQFVNHEEGRVIMKGASAPEYQYYLKDHLGNVRVTFTTQITTKTVTAGFEAANQTTEAGNFSNYQTAKINTITPTNANAHSGNSAYYLNGGYAGQVGVAKSFSVMPGDAVSIQAYVKYNTPSGTAANFSSFAASLLTAFNLPTPVGGETGTAASGVNAFANWEIGATGDESKGDAIKAFATIVLFDRNYNFIDVAYQAVQGNGSVNVSYTVKQAGYAYIYVSNEHPYLMDVYFDDITVTYTPSPVVQQQDYYPFGLSFNSYMRENAVQNKYQYNGKELQDANSMNWLDYGLRLYSPDIGRWSVVDSRSSKYMSWSPYSYALNSPVMNIDPNGDTVKIEVTKTTVGTTNENLYSSPEVQAGATQETKEVDAYEVNVSNELGCSATYYYTRQAYRKDPSNPTAEAEDRTFDVRNDGDSFQGKVRSRWGGTDNVLELRNPNNENDQSVDAMKAGVDASRTAIQFHVKGASDGCLMAAGSGDITVKQGTTLNTTNTGTSSSASQTNFMKTVKDFRRTDTNAGNSNYIKIVFQKK